MTQPSECPVISRSLAPDLGRVCYSIRPGLTGVLYHTAQHELQPPLPRPVQQSPGSIAAKAETKVGSK